MVLTVLSKVSGFLRDITLSYFYGATNTSDAYIISITITSVLFSLIVMGISTAYIPMFKQIENEIDHQSANTFTNNLINIVLIISSGVILFGFIFSNLFVKLFALGFDGETLTIAVLFTRIGIVSIFFTGLTQLFTSYLQLNGRFMIPAMIGLPFNFIIILFIMISSHTNYVLLAIGSVIASIVQMFFLLPALKKTNYRYAPIVKFNDKYIKKMIIVIFPVMIGISIDQINLMVDKTLASTLAEGGISALTYASRLNDFVHGIFVLSFVTVMFPLISNFAVKKNTLEFKKSISEVISIVMLIVVPASVGIMILSKPLIRLLFGRGLFDEIAINMTSEALFFYSIGMIGFGIREILNRTFYSLQDTKTPMYNAALSVILNIILNLILSSFMGISGLALGTSISAIFCATLLVFTLRKKIGSFGLRGNFITLLKVVLASFVMGIIVYILYTYLFAEWQLIIRVFMVVFVGIVIYFILITLFRVNETKIILKFFQNKIMRKISKKG